MKITMKIDQKGSEDGLTLKEFKAGETYNTNDDLGGVFVREGWAIAAVDQPTMSAPDRAPTETKPAKGPKERK